MIKYMILKLFLRIYNALDWLGYECHRVSYTFTCFTTLSLNLQFFLVDLGLLQLRVDGVLIRLRETRMHCVFGVSQNPVVLRESCWRESTFQALSAVSLCYASHAMFHMWILNVNLIVRRWPVQREWKLHPCLP